MHQRLNEMPKKTDEPRNRNGSKDTVYIGKDPTTGKPMHAKCTITFNSPIGPITNRSPRPENCENPLSIDKDHPFRPDKRYQDRGLAQVLIAAFDKKNPVVEDEDLASSMDFYRNGDISTFTWPSGEPAVIRTESDGDFFVAYAGKKALWGDVFQRRSLKEFFSDLQSRKEGIRTPFELVKEPRPPLELEYTPLTGTHAALFEPFPPRYATKHSRTHKDRVEPRPKDTAQLEEGIEDDEIQEEPSDNESDLFVPTQRYPGRLVSPKSADDDAHTEEEEQSNQLNTPDDNGVRHETTFQVSTPYWKSVSASGTPLGNDWLASLDEKIEGSGASVPVTISPRPRSPPLSDIESAPEQTGFLSNESAGETGTVSNDAIFEASRYSNPRDKMHSQGAESTSTPALRTPEILAPTITRLHELKAENQALRSQNQDLKQTIDSQESALDEVLSLVAEKRTSGAFGRNRKRSESHDRS